MIGKTFSHYKIVDKLGEGGMGAVYKAEDTTLNRLVAIKALSSHLSENDEARERFVREAQAASSLNHANITTVHELLEDEGEQFIVMEYVDGKTLREVVERGRIPIKKAVEIILQAAEGLEAAHDAGILHRDIKSANIMVNEHGRVKVMDFGLAHLEGKSQLTRTGTTMGTLAYSSPELVSGRPVNESSEIFSLGVVFYELLTGQLPFTGSSEAETVLAIISGEQSAVTQFRGDVSDQLEAVVARMLEKDTALRYQSCGELIGDLRAIQGELETTTVQISTVDNASNVRFWKLIGVGGLAVAVIVALSTLFLPSMPMATSLIAILPATNLNSPSDEEFSNLYAIDVHERLIRIAGLAPIPRSSTFQYLYKDMPAITIGQELGADYVVATSLLWLLTEDNHTAVQVSPELIDIARNRTIWSHSYGFELTGNLNPLITIAGQVADSVVAYTSPQIEETWVLSENDEAWSYYLRGLEYAREKLDIERAQTALKMFQRAVELEPGFTLAHTELSQIQIWMPWNFGWSSDYKQSAKESADKAFELNPELPEVYIALGDYYYYGSLDFNNAEVQYKKALKIHPNDHVATRRMGWIRRRQGRWEDAISFLSQSLERNPREATLLYGMGQTYRRLRQFEEAEKFFSRGIAFFPHVDNTYGEMAVLIIQRDGSVDNARQFIEEHRDPVFSDINYSLRYSDSRQLIRLFPDIFSEIWMRTSQIPSNSSATEFNIVGAILSSCRNQQTLSRALYDSARIALDTDYFENTNYRALLFSIIHAGLGNKTEAIRYGERAVELLPIQLDAFDGAAVMLGLAEVYSMVGEYEEAIDTIELLLRIPSGLSVQLLQLDPIWNPLRKLPRFQALLKKYS
ncbi:protein kinase [Gemmatimonadota bacterium]